MAWSTQNVWWRNSSAPGTFSGLFPRVRAYADPKPLPQAGGVRHRYTRTPPPRHSPGWLGGTLRAGPGPLIDPHGAHAGPGPTPPIPPLGHPTRHPALVIWLRKRRLAGHPKNVLKNAAPRFLCARLVCCSSTGPLEEVHECFVWGNPVPHIFSVIALKRPLRVFGRTAIGSPYKIYVHHTKHSCTSSRGPARRAAAAETKRSPEDFGVRVPGPDGLFSLDSDL